MSKKRKMPNWKYLSSQFELKPNYGEKCYKGSCESTFKKRLVDHKKSFNKEQYKNEKELSKKLWNLNATDNNAEIAWKNVRRSVPVNGAILRCNLCLNQTLEIAIHQEINLIKRSELNIGILINCN